MDHAAASVPGALAFLRTIVELESPTESKADVDRLGGILAQRLQELGFDVTRDPQAAHGDHIVARRSGAPGSPTVMLVGHFDTVYPLGTSTSRPFEVKEQIVVGPGVLDMKGGLTVLLNAIGTLDSVMPGAAPNLLVVMNSDEEPGSPTSRPLIERLARDVDAALVFEPAVPDASVTTGRKGVGIFHIDVRGVSAHAGVEPEKGASAIHQLAHHLVAIVEVADASVGTTVNVGAVAGGRLPYVVADEASAAIDVRVLTRQEADRVTSDFQRIASVSHVTGTVTELRGGFHRPPFESSEDMGLWHLCEAAGRLAGLDLRRHTTGGASDANNIAAVGVPTLDGLGPDGSGAHGPNEHFVLDTLHRKIAMSAMILGGFAASDSGVRRGTAAAD